MCKLRVPGVWKSVLILWLAVVALGAGTVRAQQPAGEATSGPANLALNKPHEDSDPNVSGWTPGLTDGSWKPNQRNCFATGRTDVFPKMATVDLETATEIAYVVLGVPPFGSTKTINVSVSADGKEFTEVGSYEFSLRKAENHLFEFEPVSARYVRLTWPDVYAEAVGYPVNHGFASELEVYAPGPAPTVPEPIQAPQAAAPEPADVPAPKRGPDGQVQAGFQNAHESFLARGKAGGIGVLFIGDSITAGWNGAKDTWQKHFGSYEPANFGIGGDRTQHVLWRIENGELDGISPKVVVLMIGTNNMGYPAEDIVKGDQKIVEQIQQKLPDAKLLLLGIFPRGAAPTDPSRAKIKAINVELAKLDDGAKIRYLDIGDKFLDADGNLPADVLPDGLHPNAKGYQIWAEAIQPLLDEMLK